MKTKLTPEEKSELIPHIQSVLNGGERWEAEEMHHPVEAITAAILEIDGVERTPLEDGQYGIDGFATNGWQWDWWQDFKHDGKRYVLSGSGYYGGHAFGLADE